MSNSRQNRAKPRFDYIIYWYDNVHMKGSKYLVKANNENQAKRKFKSHIKRQGIELSNIEIETTCSPPGTA
jgi:hypothetical protein